MEKKRNRLTFPEHVIINQNQAVIMNIYVPKAEFKNAMFE
jgi:hypothetical protein